MNRQFQHDNYHLNINKLTQILPKYKHHWYDLFRDSKQDGFKRKPFF
jgi:predicted GNAT superfamily acetyltransferase